ncbi:MAG: AMP-binding protein, partial [Proteobacteria bacterium]|nr:AMP-binding protein [Pseudomonadota bacterium]
MNTLLTLHDPVLARRYYDAGLWRADTFYSLAAGQAAARPDAFALRDSRHRLSWRELVDWVDATAAALHDAKLRKGDRVALWLGNRVEAIVAFLASARNGYVCNPSLHPNYTNAEHRA